MADVRAQPAADLVIAHVRVEHDAQDVIEQGLPVLAAAGPLGQGLGHLRLRGGLPAGQRLVEQQQHLVQHVNGGLGDQGQQDRVPAAVVAPREMLGREPAPDPGQEPPPLSRQHRQVDRVGVHPAQERELFEFVFHRGGRRRHRPGFEPGQARAPEHGVDGQQRVQLGPPVRGSSGATRAQVSVRARSRAVATRSRTFTTPGRTSRDDNRYSHACRNSSFGESCSIARANRNSSRSFHSPVSIDRQPAYAGHLPEMIRPGLLPLAVPTQLTHRDPEPLRQPAHHGVRRHGDLIGHEPEPRQRAQLDRHTQHVAARRN